MVYFKIFKVRTMKVILISDMVFDTPTTKVEKFRLTEPFSFLAKKVVKEYYLPKDKIIEHWKWFDTIEDVEQYLND